MGPATVRPTWPTWHLFSLQVPELVDNFIDHMPNMINDRNHAVLHTAVTCGPHAHARAYRRRRRGRGGRG